MYFALVILLALSIWLLFFVRWRELKEKVLGHSPEVYTVPDDFATIGAALQEARDGDMVVVKPGRYRENVDFLGKSVHLRSEDPSDADVVSRTVIDARSDGPGVLFHSRENKDARLEGFTITGGTGYLVRRSSVLGNEATAGGGVYIGSGCSPVVKDNVVAGNSADFGGGIYVWSNSRALLADNRVRQNRALLGGGLRVAWDFTRHERESAPGRGAVGGDRVVISGCHIVGNRAQIGGGISISRGGKARVSGCSVLRNIARWDGGGIAVWDSSQPDIEDNEILENVAGDGSDYGFGGGISIINNSTARVRSNEVRENRAVGAIDSGGGGLAVNRSSPRITNNLVVDNHCKNGESIYLWSNSEPGMRGNDLDHPVEVKPSVMQGME